mgnify:CR=1 FL=1
MNIFNKYIKKNYLKITSCFAAISLFVYYVYLANNLLFNSDDLDILININNTPFPLGDWLNGGQGYFRPISVFVIYLTKNIFGFYPLVYYLLNITLHFINAYILLRILKYQYRRKLISNENIIYYISLIFLILPNNQLNVFWVSEIHDILATLFGLLSVLFGIKYDFENKIIQLIVSLFFFVIALMAKETALLIICYFILIDFVYYFNNNFNKRILRNHIMYVLMIIIYFIYKIITFGSILTNNLTFTINIRNSLSLIWQIIFPVDFLDYVGAYTYSSYFFAVLTILLITFILLLSIIYFKEKRDLKIRIFYIVLFFFSIIILNSNILFSPRLLYIILPIFLFVLTLFDGLWISRKLFLKTITIVYLALISIGQYYNYGKIITIKNYYIENKLFVENNKDKLMNKKILDLTVIERIGLFHVYINKNQLIGMISNTWLENRSNNVIAPFYLLISVYDEEYKSLLKYNFNHKDNSLIIGIKNDYSVIDYEKQLNVLPQIKVFKYFKDSIYAEECLLFDEIRKKRCKKIKIKINKELKKEMLIVYYKNGNIVIEDYDSFISYIENDM